MVKSAIHQNLAAISVFRVGVAAAGERIHGVGMAHSFLISVLLVGVGLDTAAHGGDAGLPSDQRGTVKDAGPRHLQISPPPVFHTVCLRSRDRLPISPAFVMSYNPRLDYRAG
jgi:hypothetical protein